MLIPIPFTLFQEAQVVYPDMGIRRWRWALSLGCVSISVRRQIQQACPPDSPWRDIHASGFGVWLDHWWWGEEHFWWDGALRERRAKRLRAKGTDRHDLKAERLEAVVQIMRERGPASAPDAV